MTKIILVSGCDANYYPMLREWLHSVRRFAQSNDMDIGILDAGLTKEQCNSLRPLVDAIPKPDWPCPLPESKTKGKEFLKACVCRPFLREIFPGYDIYIWMDADTWIQSWKPMELFLQGAARKKITLTGQVDRAYPRAGRVKWFGRLAQPRGFYFSNARKAYGFKTAKALMPYHVLLAGMFALHKDAPHWNRWQDLVKTTMTKGKVFTAEQLSLGVMCYLEGFEYEILPAWTHWLCEFKPLWDDKNKVFVETYLPHNPLGVLHLSGFDAMRLDRSVTTNFKTLDGREVQMSYRYPYYDGETNEETGVRLAV